MADVPAWVLITNTVVVGGFGLAGAYLVPKAQREARLHDGKRADAAIMREKAGEVFKELAALDTEGAAATIANIASLQPGVELDPNAKIRGLDDLRALLAVYFPAALPILDEHDKHTQNDMLKIRADLEKAAKANPQTAANEIAGVRVMMVFQIWTRVGVTTKKIKAFMIDAVKPYVPNQN